MLHVFMHALIDSLKVFGFVFIMYVILSFIEIKIAKLLRKDKKASPLFGALVGLVPQCGISVVASDLYLKKHITVGTLIAVFLSCSDEALPILLTSQKALWAIPLILIKFMVGFLVGFLLDLFVSKKEVQEHVSHCDGSNIPEHIGCCHHTIDKEEENKWHEHLVHPLIHSLKLFVTIFIINMIFGTIIHYVGNDTISNFLEMNKYLSPVLATLVGLIPNCASSVILTELFLANGIPFGALLAGLSVNAGLGLLFLFKRKDLLKRNILIISVLILTSLIVGYSTCLIVGF